MRFVSCTLLFPNFATFLFTAMVNTNLDKRVNPPGQVFKRPKLSIFNIHWVMCVHHFRWSGMTIWIRRSDASQTFSYLIPIFCVRSYAWWLLFFMTRHLLLFTVIEHVCDFLNDPAAGVRTLCPSFHGFGLQGYADDFVWAISVTHEGCLYTDVRLQEKPSNEHDNWSTTTNLSAVIHLRTDFFNVFLYYSIQQANKLFSAEIFCSSINVLLAYKLYRSESGRDSNWFHPW